jgi:hypothetical protein
VTVKHLYQVLVKVRQLSNFIKFHCASKASKYFYQVPVRQAILSSDTGKQASKQFYKVAVNKQAILSSDSKASKQANNSID